MDTVPFRSLNLIPWSSATKFKPKIQLGHAYDSWLFIFESTLDKVMIKNYFATFSNLTFNSRIYVASVDGQTATFFDVYKKASGMEVIFEEVQIFLKLYEWTLL